MRDFLARIAAYGTTATTGSFRFLSSRREGASTSLLLQSPFSSLSLYTAMLAHIALTSVLAASGLVAASPAPVDAATPVADIVDVANDSPLVKREAKVLSIPLINLGNANTGGYVCPVFFDSPFLANCFSPRSGSPGWTILPDPLPVRPLPSLLSVYQPNSSLVPLQLRVPSSRPAAPTSSSPKRLRPLDLRRTRASTATPLSAVRVSLSALTNTID
jgi:hypothetical protein